MAKKKKHTKEDLRHIFNDTKRTAWIWNHKPVTDKFTEQVSIIPRRPRIVVEENDTVTSAISASVLGKTCVLNMASAKTGGGGVAHGETAQEECLFRCSNLSQTITQDFYPLKENEALYTKDAIFFKDVNYKEMAPIRVDVVTVAAVNLNINSRYDEEEEVWIDGIIPKPKNYLKLTKMKIRTMLTLAAKNECEYIILGAWGCGVFKNKPEDIADAFYEVLVDEEYERLFTKVVFGIINDNNSVANNVSIFQKVFN